MLRRKIKRGFLLIGTLLFLSGIISSFELIRLNLATSELLSASRGNIELSKDLMDIVQEQNTLLLVGITDSLGVDRDELLKYTAKFNATLSKIEKSFQDNSQIESSIKTIKVNALAYSEALGLEISQMTMNWFVQVYRSTYHDLTASIKEFMIKNENSIVASAQNVESNAHRAAMVGIIALAAGILLIVLFYYFLNMLYIAPLLAIEKALYKFINKSQPFKVEVHTKGELFRLRNHIEVLTERSQKR